GVSWALLRDRRWVAFWDREYLAGPGFLGNGGGVSAAGISAGGAGLFRLCAGVAAGGWECAVRNSPRGDGAGHDDLSARDALSARCLHLCAARRRAAEVDWPVRSLADPCQSTLGVGADLLCADGGGGL